MLTRVDDKNASNNQADQEIGIIEVVHYSHAFYYGFDICLNTRNLTPAGFIAMLTDNRHRFLYDDSLVLSEDCPKTYTIGKSPEEKVYQLESGSYRYAAQFCMSSLELNKKLDEITKHSSMVTLGGLGGLFAAINEPEKFKKIRELSHFLAENIVEIRVDVEENGKWKNCHKSYPNQTQDTSLNESSARQCRML